MADDERPTAEELLAAVLLGEQEIMRQANDRAAREREQQE